MRDFKSLNRVKILMAIKAYGNYSTISPKWEDMLRRLIDHMEESSVMGLVGLYSENDC